MNDIKEVQAQTAIINNAKTEPVTVEGHSPVMLVHQAMSLKGIEEHSDKPYRAKVDRTFNTVKAMAQYLKDFATPATRVFADLRKCTVDAVIDYHTKDTPAWGSHKLKLELVTDSDYAALVSGNNDWKAHKSFVRFMMDYAVYVKASAQTVAGGFKAMEQADFVELIRDLEAMNAASVKSQVGNSSQTSSGNSASKVTSGGNELPEAITLELPVYVGEAPVTHTLRLQSDTDGSGLALRYVLVRNDKVKEDAFKAVVQTLEKDSDVKVYGL